MEEDKAEMETAIQHFYGRYLGWPLGGDFSIMPDNSGLDPISFGRLLELTIMGRGIFLLLLMDTVSTDALLACFPISSGSCLLAFERWIPQFDLDEFDCQQRIPLFSVTLSFLGLPIFMRRCIPRLVASELMAVVLSSILMQIIVLEDTKEYISYVPKKESDAQQRSPFDLLVICNPVLKKQGTQRARFFEGCLSVEGYRGLVERHLEVEVSGFGRDGSPIKIKASGWQARVLQHECDHLQGIP
ncbi:hypothetical protein L7F22_013170 [Adiantum nelumboides]|nr:hypothetical protein [Adiantum nelumboides]